MINIVINNFNCKFPDNWNELTLDKAIRLKQLFSEHPDYEYWSLQGRYSVLLNVACLNSSQILDSTIHDFKYLWDRCLLRFVQGLTSVTDYTLCNNCYFFIDNVKYEFPKIFSFEDFKQSTTLTAYDFAEICTWYFENPLINANKIISQFCSCPLADTQNITMDVVFESFNLLTKVYDYWILLCPTMSQSVLNQQDAVIVDWHDAMLFLSLGSSLEYSHIKNLPLIDFFRLLEFKLKNTLS